MCELFALSASQPVDITLSLAELARHGGEIGIHTDGWGVAFMEGHDVWLLREPSAAATSPWVRCLQNLPVRSTTVLAHIRHATHGAVCLANTQPFVRELGGYAHVLAHNGHLGDSGNASTHTRPRFQPIGDTDSEAAFCQLLGRFAEGRDNDEATGSDRYFETFAAFAHEARSRGPANIIHISHDRLLVHADRRTQRPGVIEPPGLWMLHRSCRTSEANPITGGGVDVRGEALSVVLFASVPLTNELWLPLERGTVIACKQGTIQQQRLI